MKYHKAQDAAKFLTEVWGVTVTVDTLRYWVRMGHVPAIRTPSGRILISDEVLRHLSDKGAVDATPSRVAGRGPDDPATT